jgi:8-oxo-dGTP pyrophosphatase MutT (NUDIX family)
MTLVGPWERRSRELVYENAWIQVFHDEVTRPDGEPGVYGVVHPKTMAVGVVAIDDEDRVALVGQHRYTIDEYSWEIPEGGVPEGEDPVVGAERELEEEAGVVAGQIRELLRVTLQDSVTDERAIVFMATDLTETGTSPEGTEDITVRWVGFDEVVAMVDDGRITDALSQLAILKVALDRARA